MESLKSIEIYEERIYERGEQIEYCVCGHSSLYHSAELKRDENGSFVDDLMDDNKKFECDKCRLEGKFCVNFR